MPRPGDSVSLSIAPTIELAKFTFLKATATITRTMGSDPEADLQDMRTELSRLYGEAVGVELGIFNEVVEIIEGGGDTDDLRQWAVEKARGNEEEDIEEGSEEEVRPTPRKRASSERTSSERTSSAASRRTAKKTRRRSRG